MLRLGDGVSPWPAIPDAMRRSAPIATGLLRQICYKLHNGEASWILRPTNLLQF